MVTQRSYSGATRRHSRSTLVGADLARRSWPSPSRSDRAPVSAGTPSAFQSSSPIGSTRTSAEVFAGYEREARGEHAAGRMPDHHDLVEFRATRSARGCSAKLLEAVLIHSGLVDLHQPIWARHPIAIAAQGPDRLLPRSQRKNSCHAARRPSCPFGFSGLHVHVSITIGSPCDSKAKLWEAHG